MQARRSLEVQLLVAEEEKSDRKLVRLVEEFYLWALPPWSYGWTAWVFGPLSMRQQKPRRMYSEERKVSWLLLGQSLPLLSLLFDAMEEKPDSWVEMP